MKDTTTGTKSSDRPWPKYVDADVSKWRRSGDSLGRKIYHLLPLEVSPIPPTDSAGKEDIGDQVLTPYDPKTTRPNSPMGEMTTLVVCKSVEVPDKQGGNVVFPGQDDRRSYGMRCLRMFQTPSQSQDTLTIKNRVQGEQRTTAM